MPGKALITVVVGEDRLAVPFDTARSCAELLGEVKRRAEGASASELGALRVDREDGPTVFGGDCVADVLGEARVLYAGPVRSVQGSPVRCCPSTASSPTVASTPVPASPVRCCPSIASSPTVASTPVNAGRGPNPADQSVKGPATEEAGAWYFSPPPRAASGSVPPEGRSAASPTAERASPAAERSQSANARVECSDPQGSYLEDVSDRRVDWVIPAARTKLRDYPKGTRLFSPYFASFGLDQLRLVLYPAGNSSAKPGFCSLGLKAPNGARLRYKLMAGHVEKFTELRHDVTESWGFVDMCRLSDVDADELRVCVEIIDDIEKNESLVEAAPSRIEWELRSMTTKLKYYRKDVALYSEEFSIAGVDKLRMKLYPNGKKEAEEGWCSLYLEAPKGSALRCRLSVGKKGMSFDRVEKFGDDSIWGFLTLCRIQEELDGDTLSVGLQVLDAKRDVQLSDAEDAYLKKQPAAARAWLLGELERVERARQLEGEVPSRFRILQLELPDSAKSVALAKLESLTDCGSAEGTKLKRWLDGILQIPFGKLATQSVRIAEEGAVRAYLSRAQAKLNGAVFGHEEPKEKIMQILCQWISNPSSQSLVLGIEGPPGNGKTTLCRQGIAEALNRPFVQISLGGATDASVLEGHSYTYVGSSWGRIAALLMEVQCMNPVIFFDELDKVSGTPKGDEINGVLTHLTDHSQNSNFADRYFDGIPLDLSKAMFIFSFNDASKVPAVLRDRLTVIKTKGFEQDAKLKIAQRYLLPELLKNVALEPGDVVLPEGRQGLADMAYLLEKSGAQRDAGGVRGLKQALETAVLHVNKLRLLQEVEKADGEVDGDEAVCDKADGDEADGDKAVGDKADGDKADGDKADGDAPDVDKPDVGKAGGEADGDKADGGEGCAKTADEERAGDYDGLAKAVMNVTLPLTLDRAAIDKLLPERASGEGSHARMYV